MIMFTSFRWYNLRFFRKSAHASRQQLKQPLISHLVSRIPAILWMQEHKTIFRVVKETAIWRLNLNPKSHPWPKCILGWGNILIVSYNWGKSCTIFRFSGNFFLLSWAVWTASFVSSNYIGKKEVPILNKSCKTGKMPRQWQGYTIVVFVTFFITTVMGGAVFETAKPIFTTPNDFKIFFTTPDTPPNNPATIITGQTVRNFACVFYVIESNVAKWQAFAQLLFFHHPRLYPSIPLKIWAFSTRLESC